MCASKTGKSCARTSVARRPTRHAKASAAARRFIPMGTMASPVRQSGPPACSACHSARPIARATSSRDGPTCRGTGAPPQACTGGNGLSAAPRPPALGSAAGRRPARHRWWRRSWSETGQQDPADFVGPNQCASGGVRRPWMSPSTTTPPVMAPQVPSRAPPTPPPSPVSRQTASGGMSVSVIARNARNTRSAQFDLSPWAASTASASRSNAARSPSLTRAIVGSSWSRPPRGGLRELVRHGIFVETATPRNTSP